MDEPLSYSSDKVTEFRAFYIASSDAQPLRSARCEKTFYSFNLLGSVERESDGWNVQFFSSSSFYLLSNTCLSYSSLCLLSKLSLYRRSYGFIAMCFYGLLRISGLLISNSSPKLPSFSPISRYAFGSAWEIASNSLATWFLLFYSVESTLLANFFVISLYMSSNVSYV